MRGGGVGLIWVRMTMSSEEEEEEEEKKKSNEKRSSTIVRRRIQHSISKPSSP